MFPKLNNVADGRSPPPVDGLIIIANDCDIFPLASKKYGKFILCKVGVLKFIDKNVFKLILILFENAFTASKKFQGICYEI